jgi:peptidoglycan hydrolase-like protein with peptidoglycan-binding domain
MKKTLIACAALAALVAISASPAEARTTHHAKAPATKAFHSRLDTLHLQSKLAKLGHYTGPQDGIYGPLTKLAVQEFQRENRIFITGSANNKTRLELRQMIADMNGGSAPALPVAGSDGRYSQPVAYFANPWQTQPQYIYPGMVYAKPASK